MKLRCEAVRWIDGSAFPGLVEVAFTDADGVRRSFVDKVPVFDDANRIQPDGPYPAPVLVGCEVLTTAGEDGVVTITTERPWGLESQDGVSEFRVRPHQLRYGEPPAP